MPFIKGITPWNKGKKTGIIPKTAFKKGQRVSISTEFKKGQSPWNKGKHTPYHGKGFKKGNTGEKSPAWKGGTTKTSQGYIEQRTAPYSKKLQHRLVMEKHLGRKLVGKECVHHMNEIKDDNHIENLHLCANESEHRSFHKTAILNKV